MMQLPESFDHPVDLPFNHAVLRGYFVLESPDHDPGGSGYRLLLQGGRLLLLAGNGSLPEDGISVADTSPPLYLGRWDGLPLLVSTLAKEADLPESLIAVDLTAQHPMLSIELLSIGALARHILHWEKNSRYCSRCGGATTRVLREWGKRCDACGALHYPHLHPCVIVLVRRPGEVLLTRKAEWAPGRYSLVAGFLDFGECLEEGVRREVFEETGVEIDNIRYVGSQAWPFPSQVMCGFVADYVSGEVRVEEDELEDARWFSLDDLPKLPPQRSIARFILDRYLAG